MDIHGLIDDRFPDNTDAEITPEQARNVLHVLADLGDNDRLSLFKRVKCDTDQHPQWYPGNSTLSELLLRPELFCLGTQIQQLFPQATYVIEFDGRAQPALRVHSECSVDSGLTGGKLVLLDSPEALTANIPEWSATFNSTTTPPGYPLGFTIRATFAGIEGLYRARLPGQLPAPTAAAGDANWLPVAPPAPSTGTVVLRWIEATFAMRDGVLQPGRWYYLLNGGDNFRDVLVQAASAERFAPSGLLIYPSTQQGNQTVPGLLLPALLDVPTSYAEPLREETITRADLLTRLATRPALIVGKTYAIQRPATGGQPAVTLYFSVDRADSRVCERTSLSGFPGLFRYDLVADTLSEVGAVTATLYSSTGQNTDGAMTQKASTQQFNNINNAFDNGVYPLLGLDFRNTYHYTSANTSQTLLLYTNSVSSFADASDSYQAALTEQPTGSTFADAGMGRALVLSAAVANTSAITLKLINGYKLDGIDELKLDPGQWAIIGRAATANAGQKLLYQTILHGGGTSTASSAQVAAPAYLGTSNSQIFFYPAGGETDLSKYEIARTYQDGPPTAAGQYVFMDLPGGSSVQFGLIAVLYPPNAQNSTAEYLRLKATNTAPAGPIARAYDPFGLFSVKLRANDSASYILKSGRYDRPVLRIFGQNGADNADGIGQMSPLTQWFGADQTTPVSSVNANGFFYAPGYRVPSPDMAGNAEFTVGADEQNTTTQAVYIIPPADARRLFFGTSTRKVFLNLKNVYSIESMPLFNTSGAPLMVGGPDGSHCLARVGNSVVISASGDAAASVELRVKNSGGGSLAECPVVLNANQRGVILPRYTTAEQDALVMEPDDAGRLIFNTTGNVVMGWTGSKWKLASESGAVDNSYYTCIVTAGTGGSFYNGNMIRGGFNVVAFPAVNLDGSGSWNGNNYSYTVPVTGLYNITTKVRLTDQAAGGGGFGYAQGPQRMADGDGPQILWFQTNNNRQGSFNEWTVYLAAGEAICCKYFLDGFDNLYYTAEMVIRKVG